MTISKLSAVLPYAEIQSLFTMKGIRTAEYGINDLEKIMQLCGSDIFMLATHCATRVRQIYQPNVDLQPLAPLLPSRDPKIIYAIGDILHADTIQDIYCCRCDVQDDALQDPLVAAILIARVYPQDLYIGNLTFRNPYQPLPMDLRKSVLHTHKGLGLLPKFMANVESYAAANQCKNITLVANETSQAELFAKYGYSVDGYEVAQRAMVAGRTIPMSKRLE